MPSSSNELISAALKSALKTKSESLQERSFTEKLLVSSKQILLNTVEYEKVSNKDVFDVNSLKNRHVNLTSKKLYQSVQSMAHGKSQDKLEDPRVVLWPSEKVILGWKKTFHPGSGMANLGNTCYLNSSLQALFHIPAMVNWLLDETGTHIERCSSNPQIVNFCSICAMMRTLKLSLDRSSNVIKPSVFHNKLKCIGKTLNYGRQEDAHEFIKLLIDHMEKSYISFRRAQKLDYRSKETTPLNQIFGGYLRQQVICPLCRYVSTTFSHFQDLVLDIRSVGSVEEALGLYFRKETLDSDNAYKCENCTKKVPATKRHLIEKAPYVLLLQLKRFTISGGKINKHINIQKTIDLSRYINGFRQTKEDGSYIYRLVSMVIHIGSSQHGGHYTAIAQASNGIMFEFDDSMVSSIPLQSALLRNPYILFYEMIRKPKDILNARQVIRQSSEKILLNQRPCDPLSKSLPSSRSTNCMANGVTAKAESSPQDMRNGIYQLTKSPLVNHKGREKISSPTKSFSWCKTSKTSSSSLIPYSEDSESDTEQTNENMPNGSNSLPSKSNDSKHQYELNQRKKVFHFDMNGKSVNSHSILHNGKMSEQNFSSEEKKSKYIWTSVHRSDCDSDTEDYSKNSIPNGDSKINGSGVNINSKNSLPNGDSKLNGNVVNIEWNRNLRDLSKPFVRKSMDDSTSENAIRENGISNDRSLCNGSGSRTLVPSLMSSESGTRENGLTNNKSLCNGSAPRTIVQSLMSSASLCFGAKVNKWDDAPSALDISVAKEKQDAFKRSAVDMFNDEIDAGKLPKKRPKQTTQGVSSQSIENPFQKCQDFNSNRKKDSYSNSTWGGFGGRKDRFSYHSNKNFQRSKSWSGKPHNNKGWFRNFQGGNGGGKSWHRRNSGGGNFNKNNSFSFRDYKQSGYYKQKRNPS